MADRLNIKKAIKRPGALREQLGVGARERIPEAKLNKAAKAGGGPERRWIPVKQPPDRPATQR